MPRPRTAAERGWEVVAFDHPVPLRARVARPTTNSVVRLLGLLTGLVLVAGGVLVATPTLRRRPRSATGAG